MNEKLALADALERALNDEVAWAKGKTFKEATDEIQKWRSSFGGKIAYGIDSRGRALAARAVTEEPYRAEEKLMHNRLLNIFEQEAFGDELIGKEPQEVEGNIIRVVDPNLPRDGWNSANRIVEILNYGVRKPGSSTPRERTKVRCGGYEHGLRH